MLTALVDDLTAIDSAATAGDVGRDQFSATKSGFLIDVGRARSLGSPGGRFAARWSSTLNQIGGVAGELDGPNTPDGRLRAQVEGAAEALVSFVATMERR